LNRCGEFEKPLSCLVRWYIEDEVTSIDIGEAKSCPGEFDSFTYHRFINPMREGVAPRLTVVCQHYTMFISHGNTDVNPGVVGIKHWRYHHELIKGMDNRELALKLFSEHVLK